MWPNVQGIESSYCVLWPKFWLNNAKDGLDDWRFSCSSSSYYSYAGKFLSRKADVLQNCRQLGIIASCKAHKLNRRIFGPILMQIFTLLWCIILFLKSSSTIWLFPELFLSIKLSKQQISLITQQKTLRDDDLTQEKLKIIINIDKKEHSDCVKTIIRRVVRMDANNHA